MKSKLVSELEKLDVLSNNPQAVSYTALCIFQEWLIDANKDYSPPLSYPIDNLIEAIEEHKSTIEQFSQKTKGL